MAKRKARLPSDWWSREYTCKTFTQYAGSHLVGLMTVVTDGKADYHQIHTGMLIELRGVPMWVSAGHALKDLEVTLNDPKFKIRCIQFLDAVHTDSYPPIPVDREHLKLYWTDKGGIDLGFVILDHYYKRLLSKPKSNKFLHERVWANLEQARPAGYYLVGFPRECHTRSDTEYEKGKFNVRVKADMLCLPVERIPDRPLESQDGFWGQKGAWYGKLIPFSDTNRRGPRSIDYMSGGPIFSIEQTPSGRHKYYLHGIQSAWLPESRIIRATGIEAAEQVLVALFIRALESKGAMPPE